MCLLVWEEVVRAGGGGSSSHVVVVVVIIEKTSAHLEPHVLVHLEEDGALVSEIAPLKRGRAALCGAVLLVDGKRGKGRGWVPARARQDIGAVWDAESHQRVEVVGGVGVIGSSSSTFVEGNNVRIREEQYISSSWGGGGRSPSGSIIARGLEVPEELVHVDLGEIISCPGCVRVQRAKPIKAVGIHSYRAAAGVFVVFDVVLFLQCKFSGLVGTSVCLEMSKLVVGSHWRADKKPFSLLLSLRVSGWKLLPPETGIRRLVVLRRRSRRGGGGARGRFQTKPIVWECCCSCPEFMLSFAQPLEAQRLPSCWASRSHRVLCDSWWRGWWSHRLPV